tara:strand:+ start:696 stop:1052 length:357 start_codon:yes stop_codon:yes gene_type:complete
MKITKSELKKLIKEEIESVITERLSQREFRQEVFNLAKAFDNPEYIKMALNPLKNLYSKLDIGYGDEKIKRSYAEEVIRSAFSQYSDTEQQDLLSQLTTDQAYTRYGDKMAAQIKDTY